MKTAFFEIKKSECRIKVEIDFAIADGIATALHQIQQHFKLSHGELDAHVIMALTQISFDLGHESGHICEQEHANDPQIDKSQHKKKKEVIH